MGTQRKAARRKRESKADKCHAWAVVWTISMSKSHVISLQCTYMEEVRTMLQIQACCAEDFSTATHRGPTKALDGHNPHKMMDDVKPDLADLRVFGALCAIIGQSRRLKNRVWAVGWAASVNGAHVIVT